jgi:hypothetical protein
MILVNNATSTVHNIVTVDPSVGIIYAPITGVYQISLTVNLELDPSVLVSKTISISIVRNGLPTDAAAVLDSVIAVLHPDGPEVISIGMFRHLKGEDYIQVFVTATDDTTFTIVNLGYDFSLQLLKAHGAS